MKKYFKDLGNSSSLKEGAYKIIKLQIITGNLKPGRWLRVEELSKSLNISNPPIREALNMLEREGFVTIIPRKGAKIADVTSQKAEDLFEVRELLESFALKKSVGKIPLKKLEKIEYEFKEFINKIENDENRIQYLNLDKKFHDFLTENCGNKELIKLLTNLSERIYWFRSLSLSKTSFNDATKKHLSIIDSIKKNDKKLIKESIKQHFKGAKKSLLREVKSL